MGGISLYGWGAVAQCVGQGPAQNDVGWNFVMVQLYGEFSITSAAMAPHRGKFGGIFTENREFLDSWPNHTKYLPIVAEFRKSIFRATTTASRDRWWPFTACNYRFSRSVAKLYLDRLYIDPFSGLKKWPIGGAMNSIWSAERVNGGFVSNQG